jgi:hypothetical protein
VRGRESSCRALTGPTGRRIGHEGNDKEERRVCASVLRDSRRAHWREMRCRGARSAPGEDDDWAYARCSTEHWRPEHGR